VLLYEYNRTHADMQDSIGLMIDKKVASKRIS